MHRGPNMQRFSFVFLPNKSGVHPEGSEENVAKSIDFIAP